MALDAYQQTHVLIGNSKNVLVIVGKREIEDVYPAGLALKNTLDNSHRESSLFLPWDVPDSFNFLGEYKDIIHKDINGSKGIVISIDTTHQPVRQISYERKETSLDIYVHPLDSRQLVEQDIHISTSGFAYDLIITIGVDDLASLGEHFEKNAQFFYETPIINLDHNPANERYGEINLIETTSSSCSEIMTLLIKKWDENLFNKSITTSLLAGIISTTQNFQNIRTKPSTLYEAAYLMSHEADQQEIIRHLFKTKPFEIIKLCGIAMTKLQYKEEAQLGWITLTLDDFAETETSVDAAPLIISELKNDFPQPNSLIIFYELKNSFNGIAYLSQKENSIKIINYLQGEKEGNNILFKIASKNPTERDKIIAEVSRIIKGTELQ